MLTVPVDVIQDPSIRPSKSLNKESERPTHRRC